MAWLLRQGDVLASLEVPASRRERACAVASHDPGGGGAVLLRPARFAHSFGAQVAFDVAHLDAGLVVVAVSRLARRRVVRPRHRASSLLLAENGTFERWGLVQGDALELKE